MLFNFRLTPLDAVVPAIRDGVEYLHWFGLTDGCYWLRGPDAELFRYRQQYLDDLGIHLECHPYVDYYVARLWEDLLDVLPQIQAPVPVSLIEKLAPENFLAWGGRAYDWLQLQKDQVAAQEIYRRAVDWWSRRTLPTGHLRNGPTIWFWSDGTDIHIAWDSRAQQTTGVPVWDSEIGSWSLAMDAFLAQIKAFDSAFIQAMQLRVDYIVKDWSHPTIKLDKTQLVLEHAERSTRLRQMLNKQGHTDDWDAVIEAINHIEADHK